MPRNLFIIGTGGLAREIAKMLAFSNLADHNFIGFIAECCDEVGRLYSGHQVVGSDSNLPFSEDDNVDIIIAIGHASVRQKVANKYANYKNCSFPNVYDKSARVADSLNCGIGNIFLFNCFISTEVIIGNFNLFNWCTTVGHDVKIGDGCIVNPHAHVSGYCNIGDGVLIGAGASVLEYCSVVSGSLIGAGAVVTKDILNKGTYVGVPAR